MKYDDASWHYNGEFPVSSPKDYGGTHVGLFLRWCFVKGWAGELHTVSTPEEVSQVIDGSLPGTDFLFKNCDGKFTDEDLTLEGNEFAAKYYGDDGLYFDDYANNFGELMYLKPESDHDFGVYSSMVESRLESGVFTSADMVKQKPRSWWKRLLSIFNFS